MIEAETLLCRAVLVSVSDMRSHINQVEKKSLFFSIDSRIIFVVEDATYIRYPIACHMLLDFKDWVHFS